MGIGKRVLIVGGVAAGMSAATRLRRLDETAEIVVLEQGRHVSFANCGLPYHLGGVIEQRDALLRDAEGLATRFRLDIRTGRAAVRLDTAGRTLVVRDVETGEETAEPYDALVLAQGASAGTLVHDGSVPVHTLRTVDDMDALVAALDGGARRAVVLGAGYIGLEAAENLVRRGLTVTLVTRGAQALRTLDPEMAAPVHAELRAHGVDVRFERVVDRVESGAAVLDGGETVPTDLVVEAIGIAPDAGLARAAGLRLGPTGGIAVDAQHRTSAQDVYAAGDAAEKVDAVDGAPTLVALAGLANRHGRAVADAIAGVPTDSAPALGTAVVGVFDLVVATLGWTEGRLRAARRAYRVLHTHPANHATYFPGAATMAIKLLVDAETDRILGAQIVGREGVDKRIDVLATAVAGGIPASALSRLELAYAPQFGSAKDAVNLLGYVAENLATGTARSVQWHELPERLAGGATLVDVRTAREFAAGSIPGAVNLPLDELRERHGELPDGELIVHCQVGQRGFTAARLLQQLGHDVANLDGGWVTWRAGHETQGGAPTA